MIVPTGRAGRLVNRWGLEVPPPLHTRYPVICEHPSPHKHTRFLLFCLPTLGRTTWPHQRKEPGHHLVGPGANGATQLAAMTFSGLIGNGAVICRLCVTQHTRGGRARRRQNTPPPGHSGATVATSRWLVGSRR